MRSAFVYGDKWNSKARLSQRQVIYWRPYPYLLDPVAAVRQLITYLFYLLNAVAGLIILFFMTCFEKSFKMSFGNKLWPVDPSVVPWQNLTCQGYQEYG